MSLRIGELSIGALAKQTGTKVETIRYYERILSATEKCRRVYRRIYFTTASA